MEHDSYTLRSRTGAYAIDRSLPLVTGILAVGYFLGFLVVNGHYARYQIVHVEAFRLHYLIAAMLFLVMTGVPVAAIAITFRNLSRSWTRNTPFKRPLGRTAGLAVLQAVFLIVGVVLSWVFVLNFLGMGSVRSWWLESLIYLLIVSLALGIGTHYHRTRVRGPNWRTVWSTLELPDLHQVIFAVGIMVSVAGAYGAYVYPHVHPTWGGGGTWVANLDLSDVEAYTRTGIGSDLNDVLVLSMNNDRVRIIACDSRDEAVGRRLIDIPSANVLAISLLRLEAAPVYLRECRKVE